MGEYAIKMPDIGEGIAEAELIEWLVNVGDEVATDAPLAEVTTDKARVQIPSPVAGTVHSLGAEPGEFIAVGAELIRLTVAGGGNVGPAARTEEADRTVATAKPGDARSEVSAKSGNPTKREHSAELEEPAQSARPAIAASAKVLAAPAVRGRARDAGVDLGDVRATGPEGRVTAADLAAHLNRSGAAPAPAAESVEDIQLMGIRRITAKRMQQAWREVPHITIVEEVDVTELESLRTRLNSDHTPRVTVLPFVMRAIVAAVGEQPEFNAHFDDQTDTIRRYTPVHVGIATQAPDGLKVPVIRDAGALDLWEAAARIEELSAAVRDGRAGREELSGSTITVTSLGKLGAIATTPIINRPEVAIVGVNRMAVRPMWNGSEFVPRTMMNLSSSFDHRVIDGWAAARFVARLKELLEMPALLFIPTKPQGA
ncbi:dihydrolipoamide acetyltransferase family protein [Granulicoccus sp. GXG6511]|uniref:dihydrolipoamide acetyltransferase family protein n=1 Tax=Granulicoccus sp. GXG6511 TaxID=3381351 RepID=UPI003D7D2BD0